LGRLQIHRYRRAAWPHLLMPVAGHDFNPQWGKNGSAGGNARRSRLGGRRRLRHRGQGSVSAFADNGGRTGRSHRRGDGSGIWARGWRRIFNCFIICYIRIRSREPEVPVFDQDKAESHQKQYQRHDHAPALSLVMLHNRDRRSDFKPRYSDLCAGFWPLKLF